MKISLKHAMNIVNENLREFFVHECPGNLCGNCKSNTICRNCLDLQHLANSIDDSIVIDTKWFDGKEQKSDMKAKLEKAIEKFNFQAIRNLMLSMDWRWAMRGTFVVPSIPDMIKTVRRLFDSCVEMREEKDDSQSISSGGFTVSVDFEEQSVEIKFTISSNYNASNGCW